MIKLSRRTSFFLAGGLLVGFFALALYMSSDHQLGSNSGNPTLTTPEQELEQSPSGSVVLTNFHRSQTGPNGEKEWEITADKGEYTPGSNLISISNGLLTLFRQEGSTIRIIAPFATIELVDSTMKVVTCSGGVTIEYDEDMKLITDSMTYWKETGQIEAPKRVTIKSKSGETSGDSMKGNAVSRRFELLGKVTSVFKPNETR